MASPSTGYFGLTGDQAIDALTHGFYWRLGADRTVDWSISNGPFGDTWPDPNVTAQSVGYMLGTYAYFANIKFNYVGYYADPVSAYFGGSEINVAPSSGFPFSSSGVWGLAFFPDGQSPYYAGNFGDVYINAASQARYLSYLPGGQGWFLGLHELGHALGLKHPHDSGGTGRPTLAQLGFSELDIDLATVMSYNDDFNWNQFSWDPATPMILDVLAMQYLYGLNTSTNAGNDVHQLDRIWAYGTIWDAGGSDAVSAANSAEGWYIALPNFVMSSLVPQRIGLAIPTLDRDLGIPTTIYWLEGDIESAIGSAYSDVIIGSTSNNALMGGFGNDTIDGGGGIDVAYHSGLSSSYQTTVNGSSRTMSGPDGFDTYSNVYRFHFDNVSVAYDISGHAGQAYRLYKAAFDRAPDLPGLAYQMNVLDQGFSLAQVATAFLASPEFQSRYGAVNDTQFVTLLYQNVLDRAPDSGGLAYHLNDLAHGTTRAQILANFSESPENQVNVIGLISNGILYTG